MSNAFGESPKKMAYMQDIDCSLLSRLIKILTRSVLAAKDLDSPHLGSSFFRQMPAPAKQTPNPKSDDKVEREYADEHDLQEREFTDIEIDKFSNLLENARDSALASECCIALLASDRLPKQVRSLSSNWLTSFRNLHSCTLKSSSEAACPP